MTRVFVSHATEDAECAEHIRQGLETQGYDVWREPDYPGPTDSSYSRIIENAILKSAAVVLVWSSHSPQSEWVEQHTLFAQRLKKLLIPVIIDGASLPNTLITDTTITSQTLCTNVVVQLVPHLPASDSTDSLIKLSEQAAHEFIRERRAAIDHAVDMLQRGEHREAVLAILEYLARNDLMMGVREKAQEVLDADAKKGTTLAFRPDESRHIIGVRCKNGHITYFDKRRICHAEETVVRSAQRASVETVVGGARRAGLELDELHLMCGQCSEAVVAHVDCRGYK